MSVEPDSPDTGPEGGHGTVLPLGTRLQEFEVTGVVGEGGFGIVYEANDTLLQRRVAIKEYMPAQLASRAGGRTVKVRSPQQLETFEAGLRSFINEARMLAQFKHAALVEVFRFWEENGTAYMAMPYYEGRTLKQFLSGHPEMANERWLRSMLAPLLDALEHMHEARIFHRDIAPDNILILKNGSPLLLDLGAARRIIGDMTQAITVILKPGYAPIEQYGEESGARQGPWTDIYALAAVLYYAITRRAPSPAVARMIRDPHKRLIDVASDAGFSAGFLQAIDLALSVRPEDRPQSIAQFREMLGVTTYTVSTPPSPTVMGMLADAPAVPPVRVSSPARDASAGTSAQSAQSAQSADPARATTAPAAPTAQSPLPFDPLPPFVSGEPLAPGAPADVAASATAAVPNAPAVRTATTVKPASADKDLDATRPVPRKADARVAAAGVGIPAPKTGGARSRGPLLVVIVGVAAVVGALVVVGALLMNSVGPEPPITASTPAPSASPAPAPATSPSAPSDAGKAAAAGSDNATPPGSSSTSSASNTPASAEPSNAPATAPTSASTAPPPSPAASGASAAAAPVATPASPPPSPAPPASSSSASSASDAPAAAPAGVASPVAAAPAERKGTLRLAIRPWGEVYVDGVARGVSPPLKRLSLDEGTHDVEVRNPAGPSAARKVQIRQNQAVDFEHRF